MKIDINPQNRSILIDYEGYINHIKGMKMKTLFKLIYKLISLILEYVVWPIVKWTLKVVAKISLFLLIKLLEVMLDTLVFAFNLIFIETLKTLLKRI